MPYFVDIVIQKITDALAGVGSSLASSSLAKSSSTFTGFDREDMDIGGKSLGILQYCQSAASGEVYQIGSDETGAYTLLTAQTHFADGTALADRTNINFKISSLFN